MPNENIQQSSRLAAEQRAAFITSIQETQEASSTLDAALTINRIEASRDKLEDAAEENSAKRIAIRTKNLERTQSPKTEKAKKAQESVLVRKDDADGLADHFSRHQGNREYRLNASLLSQLAEELGAGIHEDSHPDEIIAIIRKRLTVNGQPPDVAIVDKTFEFLLKVSEIQRNKSTGVDKTRLEKIYHKIEIAKNKHFESNAIEIQVGHKIIGAVDAVVHTFEQLEKQEGLIKETFKETLDRYRDVVHNPPDLQTLRKFYEAKGYKAMILELKGLNTYLGGNLKRTNLDNPELAQLAAAARKMQALLGVFRQSKVHIPTMESYLTLNGVIAA